MGASTGRGSRGARGGHGSPARARLRAARVVLDDGRRVPVRAAIALVRVRVRVGVRVRVRFTVRVTVTVRASLTLTLTQPVGAAIARLARRVARRAREEAVQHGQRPAAPRLAAAAAGQGRLRAPAERPLDAERLRDDAQRATHLGRVRDRARVRVRVRLGVGLRVGVDVVALGWAEARDELLEHVRRTVLGLG